MFAIAALATLVAGYFLEQSGDKIAGHIGLTGVLFGSTILAAATSLPELSTGLTSVKLGWAPTHPPSSSCTRSASPASSPSPPDFAPPGLGPVHRPRRAGN